MIKKIKSFVLSGMLLLAVSFPAAALPGAVALAASASGCGDHGIADQVAGGATTASGSSDAITCDTNTGSAGTTESAINSIATEVVNIFTIIVGAASVFMIIYGGFRYITSGGSSDKVGNAKNTLIYAIVGLIIVALAQTLIHFVLSKTANTGNTLAT